MAPMALPLLFLLAATFHTAASINCKGCTPLDTLTFDKMIQQFDVSLVKFDVSYPYGDKHDEFAKVAVDGAGVQRLLVGEVGIKDYGDKDNDELGRRFGIDKEQFPAVMLFVNEPGQGKPREVRFPADEPFTSEALKSFMRRESGLYLPMAGCLEAFDALAARLVGEAVADDDRAVVIREAEAAAAGLKDELEQRRAAVYVKIMKKLLSDDGGDFVARETERTRKLVAGKLTPEKKKELQEKINILGAFARRPAAAAKEEL